MVGPIPEWVVVAAVAATVFTVMLALGTGLAPGELRWIWRQPGPMARGLFAVLVAVPAAAFIVTRVLELPRLAEIVILLMAISPGAPVALHRSLAAGGHRALAPSLQIAAVTVTVVSMPLSIAVLSHFYVAGASIAPEHVGRQVFMAQLLPLGLGIALRRANPLLAARLEPRLKRAGTVMLAATVALVAFDFWEVTVTAGVPVLTAIVVVTVAALAIGHALGGPDPAMRTAVATISAVRNPGLALLVATLNAAPPAINATILAYLLVSVVVVAPYAAWRG